MNRRQALQALALISLTGCTTINYRQFLQEYYQQKHMTEISRIDDAIESLVFLRTETIDKNQNKYKQDGFGIAYDNFILTVAHVVSIDTQSTNTPIGQITYSIEKEKEETTIGGISLENIVKDNEKDVAVFKKPQQYTGKSYPYGLGDSDKISYGQEVLVIGNPAFEGFNVREGIVSAKKKDLFDVSALLAPGDSGTITVDRDTFQILGLNAQRLYGIAQVRPINLYKQYLKNADN